MTRKIAFLLYIVAALMLFVQCGDDEDSDEARVRQFPSNVPMEGDPESDPVAFDPTKDRELQEYNLRLEAMRERTTSRFTCDTLALMEWMIDNMEEGTYLSEFDKVYSYSYPRAAVMYLDKGQDSTRLLAIVAKSREGERLIEIDNIIGYDQSFIDLDSTELGTAFFYLSMFHCADDQFREVWDHVIPRHGGFNRLSQHTWKYNGTPYIKTNFHYARGVGHFDYNFFMIGGWDSIPHMLMTYEGINFKRTMINYNDDEYPDYQEYVFFDDGQDAVPVDSVPFYWDVERELYVNARNSRQTRPY